MNRGKVSKSSAVDAKTLKLSCEDQTGLSMRTYSFAWEGEEGEAVIAICSDMRK